MDRQEVLAKLARQEITPEQADQLLDELDRQKQQKGLYCKVSAKGAISVYGLQRMPVTLYVEQWNRLLEFAPELRQFLEKNSSKFKRKGDAPAAGGEAEGGMDAGGE